MGDLENFKTWFSFRRVPNARLWAQEPIQKIDDDYYLAIIEFDDQGWFQDPKQRSALELSAGGDVGIMRFLRRWFCPLVHTTRIKRTCGASGTES
jgi:hypothetical protein